MSKSKRNPDSYYIVPEYKRDPRRSTAAGISTRVRYAIRATTFPTWHPTGIIKDLDDELTLGEAKRKLKSWKAWAKRKQQRK